MQNRKVDDMDRSSSMGLWTDTKEYLNAAKVVASSSDRELVPTPAYYLSHVN